MLSTTILIFPRSELPQRKTYRNRSNQIQFPIGKVPKKEKICFSDLDCEWVITNCCPENAGAHWECVNIKTFKPRECPPNIVCPQYISPKPNKECKCVNGTCGVK